MSLHANVSVCLQMVRDLKDDGDHAILSVDEVQDFALAFGHAITCYEQSPANLFDPAGDRMGLGADELVEQLCAALTLRYAPKYGRGARLRECCDVLIAYLEAIIALQ